jgi:sugar phosphate isomerase/epimerase
MPPLARSSATFASMRQCNLCPNTRLVPVAEVKISLRLADLKLPFKQALHTAAQLGANAIEIDARRDLSPSELTDTGLRQIRKMLDDRNLRVSSVRFPTRRGYDVQDQLDRRVDATKQAMRMAYRLGANLVVNQIGRIPEKEDDPAWQTLRSVMEDLGKAGAREGAVLAAETGTEPADRLASLLQSLQEAYVAVAFNPGQLIIQQHDVSASLSAVASLVQIVIAQDAVIDLAQRRGIDVPLGQGLADFAFICGRLEEQPFRGYFVVTRPNSSAPVQECQQAIEYLRHV